MPSQDEKLVTELIAQISKDPAITEGLNSPYSPNHGSQTTTEHILKQLEMVRLFNQADYIALHAMVRNTDAPEHLRFSPDDLQRVLAGPRDSFSESDWKTLTILAGYHDVGKVEKQWAEKNGWNLDSVDWVAHDFDGKPILANNPSLLRPYNLQSQQRELILELTKLHSLPGQFFFGEGNVVAYEAVSEHLHIARAHGLLDVMSAINHRMVKPILDSHVRLGDLLDHYHPNKKGESNTEGGLYELFAQEAQEQVETDLRLSPVTWKRLRLLMGRDCTPVHILDALTGLEDEFIDSFDRATRGRQTWYGTYIANAFGQGLIKAVKSSKNGSPVEVQATQLLIKIVASAASEIDVEKSWALSSQKPSLAVAEGREEALEVFRSLDGVSTLEDSRRFLREGTGLLQIRVADTGVEVTLSSELNKET